MLATPRSLTQVRGLIFDLDGTLIDSKLDLALSVNAALAELGRKSLPHEQIYGYVGPGGTETRGAGPWGRRGPQRSGTRTRIFSRVLSGAHAGSHGVLSRRARRSRGAGEPADGGADEQADAIQPGDPRGAGPRQDAFARFTAATASRRRSPIRWGCSPSQTSSEFLRRN